MKRMDVLQRAIQRRHYQRRTGFAMFVVLRSGTPRPTSAWITAGFGRGSR